MLHQCLRHQYQLHQSTNYADHTDLFDKEWSRHSKIRFLTMAETEVDNAVSWYQEQTEDQSLNFLR